MATTEARMKQLTGAYADLNKSNMLVGEMAVPSDHVPVVRNGVNSWEDLLTSQSAGDIIELSETMTEQIDSFEQLAIDKVGINDSTATLTQAYSGSKTQGLIDTLNTNLTSQLAAITYLSTSFKQSGDIDDTASINRALAYMNSLGGGKVRIPYRITPFIISSTLLIYGNTTLEIDKNAVIYLASGSNCRMLTNANKTTPSNLTIVDENIKITGGIWNGNGDNQTKYLPPDDHSEGSTNGFMFAGIRNLEFKPTKIINTQTYAVWIMNFENVSIEDLEIDQGDKPEVFHNQDGLHLQGPGNNAYINHVKLKTWDDSIAITADDNDPARYSSTGDIKNVTIENITLNDTMNGIRLLSGTHLLDNVTIKNIKGSVHDSAIQISSYGLGEGNFGDITIDGVYIKDLQEQYVQNLFITINNKINGTLTINNIQRNLPLHSRSTIAILESADINTLQINNVTSDLKSVIASYRDISIWNGAKIKNLFIEDHKIINGFNNAMSGMYIAGEITEAKIKKLFYPLVNSVVELDYATIDNIEFDDLYCKDNFSNVSVSNSSIAYISITNAKLPYKKILSSSTSTIGTKKIVFDEGLYGTKTTQSLTNGIYNPIDFTMTQDVYSSWVTNTYTAKHAGKYKLQMLLTLSPGSVDTVFVPSIIINGTNKSLIGRVVPVADGTDPLLTIYTFQLQENDILKFGLYANQNGASITSGEITLERYGW